MQDITFQIGKLPAKKQFHVSRRIAPIIPALLPIYVGLARGGSLMATLEQSPEILKPFAEALAGMPDDAVDYLIDTCMSVVKRQQGSGWANIWSPGGPMFDDIDLSLLLPLTVRVITVNLGPFISGLLTSQSSSPASQAQAG
ncbi:phage tail assembly chaperone [Chitinasiproducens palmae]|nr:hypothetical protein [Chitinasiproducens palmae]